MRCLPRHRVHLPGFDAAEVVAVINPLGLLARAAGAVLNLWQSEAVSRGSRGWGEVFDDPTETSDPDHEPIGVDTVQRVAMRAAQRDAYMTAFTTSPGAAAPPAASANPAGVSAPSVVPPAGPQLPMFRAAELEAINARYLVSHFPWPDDGLIGCTCGTTGFTISEWSAHVAELQVSETVFFLQSKVYDQQK